MATSWRDSGEHGLPLALGLYLLVYNCVLSDSNKLNVTIMTSECLCPYPLGIY